MEQPADETAEQKQKPSLRGPFFASDRGLAEHWAKLGPMLEEIGRQELREHGPHPYDWRVIDSLLQLGYLHGNRNPPTGLIEWQKKIAAAYAKRDRGRTDT